MNSDRHWVKAGSFGGERKEDFMGTHFTRPANSLVVEYHKESGCPIILGELGI